MNKFHFSLFLMTLLSAILTGCAQPYPNVEEGFEENWQSESYPAQVYLLPSAGAAYAQRVALIRTAKSSLEMTYFSWDKDTLGLMLLDEVKQAADRGVKVRLILDDLLVFNEKWLAELNQHPNIRIKIFNPFSARKSGWLGRAVNFSRDQKKLDNRLHEKYFNVDHEYMILGGRNIGDSYFGYSSQANFFDMDALFKGAVIEAFAKHYQTIWKSAYSEGIEHHIKTKANNAYAQFNKALRKTYKENAIVLADVNQQIQTLATPYFKEVKVTPIFDSLQKLENNNPYFRIRAERTIQNHIDNAKQVLISTPYIVPTQGEFSVIDQLLNNRAKVTLLTNSSASNDSGFIPAYYDKHRSTLLDKGVNIYEYKDDAINDDHLYHVATYYHNKTIILDNEITFIGSSNFDPRSDFLNMEIGVFIEGEGFASQVSDYLLKNKERLYWQVSRDSENNIIWRSGKLLHHDNPNYSKWHEVTNWLFRKMDAEMEL
ncbi:phospholipase [Psychromonas sp. psych-6C06]|uniref:phospholipase D family protein n=1 Tax=Psychromonas sp. psych-6C06 TaxID=2058089 RepID=UPI000C3367A6|nr:phospholipase D family protein [Psychromonas sp. psych-6C06]PKF61570.1 phospholipase [Psychromonas sp. psych-6C06]